MINKKKAIQLAEEWLVKQSTQYDFVMLHEHTLEFEAGWVFFYQTKEYVETGDITKMTGENAPVIVDKETGTLHVTGTLLPVEKYMREYMKNRK
jgi:hypothetical protein